MQQTKALLQYLEVQNMQVAVNGVYNSGRQSPEMFCQVRAGDPFLQAQLLEYGDCHPKSSGSLFSLVEGHEVEEVTVFLQRAGARFGGGF